jgi:hypothetical protein
LIWTSKFKFSFQGLEYTKHYKEIREGQVNQWQCIPNAKVNNIINRSLNQFQTRLWVHLRISGHREEQSFTCLGPYDRCSSWGTKFYMSWALRSVLIVRNKVLHVLGLTISLIVRNKVLHVLGLRISAHREDY